MNLFVNNALELKQTPPRVTFITSDGCRRSSIRPRFAKDTEETFVRGVAKLSRSDRGEVCWSQRELWFVPFWMNCFRANKFIRQECTGTATCCTDDHFTDDENPPNGQRSSTIVKNCSSMSLGFVRGA